jgi:hypothetical protein
VVSAGATRVALGGGIVEKLLVLPVTLPDAQASERDA